MAQITLNIADADLPRVVASVCAHFNYQAILQPIVGPPEPNPETPNQFTRRMVVTTLKSWVKTYEGTAAAEAARVLAATAADGVDVT